MGRYNDEVIDYLIEIVREREAKEKAKQEKEKAKQEKKSKKIEKEEEMDR